MPPKPAAGVVVLTPREKIREDIEPLVTMYRNLGSDSAAAVVNRSISDLGMELAGIADCMILHDMAQLAQPLARVQGLAESLGFVTLALVAADMRLCLHRGDPTVIAAVWARLCRVAEKALAG